MEHIVMRHRDAATLSHPISSSFARGAACIICKQRINNQNNSRRHDCDAGVRKRDSSRSMRALTHSHGRQVILLLLILGMILSYGDRNTAVAFPSRSTSGSSCCCFISFQVLGQDAAAPWKLPWGNGSRSFAWRRRTTATTRSDSWKQQQFSLSSAVTCSSTALFMAKGDGKTRKKKKKPTATDGSASPSVLGSTPSSSSSSSSPPRPLRVSNNINVPVRQQIAWAKLNKQYSSNTGRFRQSSSNSAVKRTSYRKTMDEEEWAEKRANQQRDPDWDVILTTNMTRSHPPLMIVDGYNIIHKWPRLKKHMIKNDPASARQILVEDLENLASIKGWRIECVFDGAQRQRRPTIPVVSSSGATTTATITTVTTTSSALNSNAKILDAPNKSVSKYGVRVVYTSAGIEADSYIEARCADARSVTGGTTTGSLIVATDDAMIRIAGHSAGALCMGADRFIDELKATKRAIQYRVEAAVAKVNGHAIRPERLRTPDQANPFFTTRFGRHSVIIEDKRNRTKTKQNKDELENSINDTMKHTLMANLQVPEVDENGIPWWAKIPSDYNPHK